jgi:hypothetical protein
MMRDRDDHGRTETGTRRSEAGEVRDAERRERLARAMRENLRRRKARAGRRDAPPPDAPPSGTSTT